MKTFKIGQDVPNIDMDCLMPESNQGSNQGNLILALVFPLKRKEREQGGIAQRFGVRKGKEEMV